MFPLATKEETEWLIKETGTKYKNITAECIMIYLHLCIPCLKKSKVPEKDLVVKPIVFSEMNSRAYAKSGRMERTNGSLYTLSVKSSSAKSDEIFVKWRNFLPTKIFAEENFKM